MRVVSQRRCRGSRKLYLYLVLSDGDFSEMSCRSRVVTSKEDLPVSLHIVDRAKSEISLVVVLFDTSVPQDLALSDASGESLALRVSPALFSIASKINGRIRADLCGLMRSADSSWRLGVPQVSCESAVFGFDRVTLKGSVRLFSVCREVEVRVFDRGGTRVDSSDAVGIPVVTDGEGGLASYSVTVPNRIQTLCVSFWDRDTNHVLASFVLQKWRFKQLFEESLQRVNAFDQSGYEEWLFCHKISLTEAERQRSVRFDYQPLFSIIVPLYKTPLRFFKEMADSVLAQTYGNWELILVNSTPEDVPLGKAVEEYAARDSRVRCVTLDKNYGITENTNRGIAHAKGDYLCFFDHDDILEPDILFEYAKALNERGDISLLYCDEDKLFPDGHFGNPTFKPDFSLDMVRDNNYVCHLLTVSRAKYLGIEPSGADLDGAQDHAMVLKISEQGGTVHHAPKVLYHWRMSEASTAANPDSKPYATEAGIRAVQQHLDRLGIKATVSCSHGRAFRYLVSYDVPDSTLVSIVCPLRASYANSFSDVLSKIEDVDFEAILVVSDKEYAKVEKSIQVNAPRVRCKIISITDVYSISKWNNVGARAASGDVLVFCHDDIVPKDNGWARVLAGHALRPEVGAVGTMTLQPDDSILQAGLTYSNGAMINLSAGVQLWDPGYIWLPHTTRNVAAVDGACLATRSEDFALLGGFDEAFIRGEYGTDYCFRMSDLGKLIVYTPEAAVCQQYSREKELGSSQEDRAISVADSGRLSIKWASKMVLDDPFFNPNFSNEPAEASRYRFAGQGEFVRLEH